MDQKVDPMNSAWPFEIKIFESETDLNSEISVSVPNIVIGQDREVANIIFGIDQF